MTEHNYSDLFDGLVAGYDFKGDAKDFSGNGNDGTVTGATLTTDQLGIANSAYDFDGSSDKITLTDIDLPTAGTINVWVKFDDNTQNVIITKRYGTNNDYYLNYQLQRYLNGSIYFTISTGSGVFANPSTTKLNGDNTNWHMITGTFETGTNGVKIYVDGVLEAQATGSGTIYTHNDSTKIGTSGLASPAFFNGKIRLPMIWNRALTQAEITQLYNLQSKGYIYPYPQQRQGGLSE